MSENQLEPCSWAQGELYLDYHNNEWGIPCYEPHSLFEKICLEGQQAGLSWITVLKKRENYRKQFYQFDPEKVAQMTPLEAVSLVVEGSSTSEVADTSLFSSVTGTEIVCLFGLS